MLSRVDNDMLAYNTGGGLLPGGDRRGTDPMADKLDNKHADLLQGLLRDTDFQFQQFLADSDQSATRHRGNHGGRHTDSQGTRNINTQNAYIDSHTNHLRDPSYTNIDQHYRQPRGMLHYPSTESFGADPYERERHTSNPINSRGIRQHEVRTYKNEKRKPKYTDTGHVRTSNTQGLSKSYNAPPSTSDYNALSQGSRNQRSNSHEPNRYADHGGNLVRGSYPSERYDTQSGARNKQYTDNKSNVTRSRDERNSEMYQESRNNYISRSPRRDTKDNDRSQQVFSPYSQTSAFSEDVRGSDYNSPIDTHLNQYMDDNIRTSGHDTRTRGSQDQLNQYENDRVGDLPFKSYDGRKRHQKVLADQLRNSPSNRHAETPYPTNNEPQRYHRGQVPTVHMNENPRYDDNPQKNALRSPSEVFYDRQKTFEQDFDSQLQDNITRCDSVDLDPASYYARKCREVERSLGYDSSPLETPKSSSSKEPFNDRLFNRVNDASLETSPLYKGPQQSITTPPTSARSFIDSENSFQCVEYGDYEREEQIRPTNDKIVYSKRPPTTSKSQDRSRNNNKQKRESARSKSRPRHDNQSSPTRRSRNTRNTSPPSISRHDIDWNKTTSIEDRDLSSQVRATVEKERDSYQQNTTQTRSPVPQIRSPVPQTRSPPSQYLMPERDTYIESSTTPERTRSKSRSNRRTSPIDNLRNTKDSTRDISPKPKSRSKPRQERQVSPSYPKPERDVSLPRNSKSQKPRHETELVAQEMQVSSSNKSQSQLRKDRDGSERRSAKENISSTDIKENTRNVESSHKDRSKGKGSKQSRGMAQASPYLVDNRLEKNVERASRKTNNDKDQSSRIKKSVKDISVAKSENIQKDENGDLSMYRQKIRPTTGKENKTTNKDTIPLTPGGEVPPNPLKGNVKSKEDTLEEQRVQRKHTDRDRSPYQAKETSIDTQSSRADKMRRSVKDSGVYSGQSSAEPDYHHSSGRGYHHETKPIYLNRNNTNNDVDDLDLDLDLTIDLAAIERDNNSVATDNSAEYGHTKDPHLARRSCDPEEAAVRKVSARGPDRKPRHRVVKRTAIDKVNKLKWAETPDVDTLAKQLPLPPSTKKSLTAKETRDLSRSREDEKLKSVSMFDFQSAGGTEPELVVKLTPDESEDNLPDLAKHSSKKKPSKSLRSTSLFNFDDQPVMGTGVNFVHTPSSKKPRAGKYSRDIKPGSKLKPIHDMKSSSVAEFGEYENSNYGSQQSLNAPFGSQHSLNAPEPRRRSTKSQKLKPLETKKKFQSASLCEFDKQMREEEEDMFEWAQRRRRGSKPRHRLGHHEDVGSSEYVRISRKVKKDHSVETQTQHIVVNKSRKPPLGPGEAQKQRGEVDPHRKLSIVNDETDGHLSKYQSFSNISNIGSQEHSDVNRTDDAKVEKFIYHNLKIDSEFFDDASSLEQEDELTIAYDSCNSNDNNNNNRTLISGNVYDSCEIITHDPRSVIDNAMLEQCCDKTLENTS